MLAYKNVYKLENGVLVKNTENKIEYVDNMGKKRIKTNPTYEDFAKIGMHPLSEENKMPQFDPESELVKKEITLENGKYKVSYTVIKKEVKG